ncbi:FDLD family class I lanthipeptide [Tumebacillus sp. ITR2]|uniref:FDLD family class I lanthipeptide n=1 Tax=Tumebacillus amylolyticus TaxID=2801339 RepID=A0ABS1JDC0_9BACL|nr:FDLD family class I lanthipeptide [Tumebacillus amylolyticus]
MENMFDLDIQVETDKTVSMVDVSFTHTVYDCPTKFDC